MTRLAIKRNVKIQNCNGEIVNAKRFTTRESAEKYANKTNKEIIFFKAHEYIVA